MESVKVKIIALILTAVVGVVSGMAMVDKEAVKKAYCTQSDIK
jgi:hypothetical protein